MKKTLDEIDSTLIRLLQRNGRMPNTEMAKKMGVSEATVRNRMNRLIEDGFIQIVAVGNPIKLGYEIVGNLKVNIDSKKTDHVIRELKQLEGIWYIAHTTGAIDFDMEFNVKSLEDLRSLLDKINKIDGVTRTETSFLLEHIRNRWDWRTPDAEAN
jgi:Lrp/AsnC family transcriptional regulator for asnA, asnC and gidA